jgi:anti-sigma factor RsiW
MSIHTNTHPRKSTEAQSAGACTCSPLGELLPDYIIDILEDSVAREVEDHLLDCPPCREKYLKIIAIGDALARADDEDYAEREVAEGGARVLNFSDFKRGRP